MWPGSALHGMYIWEHPRWEDYEYTLKEEQEGNPFSWFGNGYVNSQLVGDIEGTTWYLDDDKSLLPEKSALVREKVPTAPPVVGPVEGVVSSF